MSKLVIGFSRTKKWKPFSALIIWWDKIRYGSNVAISHGYGRFHSNTWSRDFIYQAAGIRSHFMGATLFDSINESVEEYELTLTDEVLVRIGQVCVDREGKPYAIKQVLGQMLVGLVWLVTFSKVDLKNPWSDGDTQTTCIEEWGRILSVELNIDAPFDLDTVSVKPFRDWIAGLPMARRTK